MADRSAYEALAIARTALADHKLSRDEWDAMIGQLKTAAAAYAEHLSTVTTERQARLIHERSRLHASRVQTVNSLAHGFGKPLPETTAIDNSATARDIDDVKQDDVPLPPAIKEQLYSALVNLHPVRPAPPPTVSPSASTAPLDLPTPLRPSPRTSPALATLALTSLSNIVTSLARSLPSLEVFAEHFDLDRAATASGTTSAGGTVAAVTSPSVAVSPAVMPPETADGGRAVSVIMIGGSVLVIDIELGVKHRTPTSDDAALPAWATQSGELAWLPTANVKITIANDVSNTDPGVGSGQAAAFTSEDVSSSTSDLQSDLDVLADLFLLGFPLPSPSSLTHSNAVDGIAVMSNELLEPNPQPDPALRLIYTGLYGEEHYLLAEHHLQSFYRVLRRLAHLDQQPAR